MISAYENVYRLETVDRRSAIQLLPDYCHETLFVDISYYIAKNCSEFFLFLEGYLEHFALLQSFYIFISRPLAGPLKMFCETVRGTLAGKHGRTPS